MPQLEWIQNISDTMDKIAISARSYNENNVVEFEHNDYVSDNNYFSKIYNAITNKIVLEITYKPFDSSEIKYTFHPYYLKQYNRCWYAFGLVPEQKDVMHYCPGCSHGVIHKLIAEVVADMGMEDKTIGISPVGCAVFAYNYIDVDWVEAAHGRAPAIATAIKRLNPSKMVFTYQGDGDLAAIGTAETIHAANRGENIVIIFVNNAIYGMTGGQMAPTTLVGMKTSTCPYGRDVALNGYPLKIGNLLAQLDGTCYSGNDKTFWLSAS